MQAAASQTRTQAEGIADASRELASVAQRIGASFEAFVTAIGNDVERRSARRSVTWKTTVWSGGGSSITGADFGLGGMRIATVRGLNMGTRLNQFWCRCEDGEGCLVEPILDGPCLRRSLQGSAEDRAASRHGHEKGGLRRSGRLFASTTSRSGLSRPAPMLGSMSRSTMTA